MTGIKTLGKLFLQKKMRREKRTLTRVGPLVNRACLIGC